MLSNKISRSYSLALLDIVYIINSKQQQNNKKEFINHTYIHLYKLWIPLFPIYFCYFDIIK